MFRNMYYNLVNGIDLYQRACFPLFVSNLDLNFHELMSVNNKYYALRYIWSIIILSEMTSDLFQTQDNWALICWVLSLFLLYHSSLIVIGKTVDRSP